MTSTEISSEDTSDGYRPGRYQSVTRNLSSKVGNLASKLQDTNKTLKDVDQMLDSYRELGEQQSNVMERLRGDLDKTAEELQEEKVRRSWRESARSLKPSDLDDDLPIHKGHSRLAQNSRQRDYDHPASDAEYTRRRKRQIRGAVRFFDDMDGIGNRHTIHQSLRDLNSGQNRLEDDFNQEFGRRTLFEIDHRRSMSDLRAASNPTQSRVNQQLFNIRDELKVERATLKKRQDEVGKISSELRVALENQKASSQPTGQAAAPNNMEYQARLVQIEAQKSQAESELDSVRRRLEQAEDGREKLKDHTGELRAALTRSDHEKQRLHEIIEKQENEVHDRRKHRSVEDYEIQHAESDRRRLQEEVRELHAQIGKSAAVMGEYSEMRKELDQSEKQRKQLSDHIQVLNKDLETKERQYLRVVGQLQELTSRFQDSDQQNVTSLTQLEVTLKRLNDMTQTAETCSSQMKDAQRKLYESEKRRDEIKARAQDTVRQWKLKCKKLEKECLRHHNTASSVTDRNKVLTKESEELRNAATTNGQQIETMRRQLAELLAMRAQMDEHVRIRDVEVNELKSLKMDLERDLRDCKVVIERLELELRGANEKASTFFDDRNKMEEQIGSLQSSHYMAQNQLQHLQAELKSAGVEKVDMSAHVAEVAAERNELRSALADMRNMEAASRNEITQLNASLKEERDKQTHQLKGIHAELQQTKAHEQQVAVEMTRRYKKDCAEYEAEVQSLRLETQEDRSMAKLQRKQHEKLKEEIERLHQELILSREETATSQRKYHRIKDDILSKAQATEDGLGQVKEMEFNLLDTKETLLHVEKDYQNILHTIGVEVDSVVDVAVLNAIEAYKAISPLKAELNEPHKWFVEIKGKLSWLRSELRERHQREHKLRSSIRDVIETGTKEQLFATELHPPRQKDSVHHPVDPASTNSSNRPPLNTIDLNTNYLEYSRRDFQNPLLNEYSLGTMEGFGDTKEMERELAIHQSFLAEQKREELSSKVHMGTQKEREKIYERYSKLQQAMVSLRKELQESPISPKPPSYRARCLTPPVQDTSRTHTRSHHAVTPPPLSLTDEEFSTQFMPHSPVSRNQAMGCMQ